jgi:uncharacterized protein YbbC (DUF1343 family)
MRIIRYALVAATTFGFVHPLARTGAVSPGITVLLTDSVRIVRGKRVGLITNHTGRDELGRSSIDLLHDTPGVRLVALFSPEHGIRGTAEGGARISSSVDEKTGVPIYSLYGTALAPTREMLDKLDVLLYDIQDVGARGYTYVWTMALAAEAANRAGVKFVVLDRPNPIRADIVEGDGIEKKFRSFTGLYDVPVRYGLTPGELARLLVGEKLIPGPITVIPMKGYRRSMWWGQTGLSWVNPSPNIRNVTSALLYTGLSFFEATNVSEGRGTDAPLQQIGASWLRDASDIARDLNRRRIPGVYFSIVSRAVSRGEKFGGQTIPMIKVNVTNRDAIRSVQIGALLLREIYRRHPAQFRWDGNGIEELSGSRALRNAVEHGGVEDLLRDWRKHSAQFSATAARYYLYPP